MERIGRTLRKAVVFLMLLGIFLCGQTVQADSAAVENARNGVVRIVAYNPGTGYVQSGSGFGVGKAGEETDIFITNWHVITDEKTNKEIKEIYILTDDKAVLLDGEGHVKDMNEKYLVRCEVLYLTDGYPDMAILKAEELVEGRIALPLYASVNVSVSSDVYALGYPAAADDANYDEEWDESYFYSDAEDVTTTKGTISKFVEAELFNGTKCIQHDAHINQGNSGGALITEDGAVIGINTYTLGNDTTYAFSICIDYALDALDNLGIDYDVYVETDNFLWVLVGIVAVAAAAGLVFLIVKKKKSGRPSNDGAERLRIQGVHGYYAGKRFTVEKNIRMGVNPDNTLSWPAGTKGISRVHCTVLMQGIRIYLQDEGSTYGTFLNGQKLTPKQPYPLKKGDIFSLASDSESFQVTGKGGTL